MRSGWSLCLAASFTLLILLALPANDCLRGADTGQDVPEVLPGPVFDFDGDGKVVTWEESLYECWFNKSGLVGEALESGKALDNGIIDASSFLLERLGSMSEAAATMALPPPSYCDQGWLCCFIGGDANRNWSVNYAGAIYIFDYLHASGTPPP
jgi:hypothetical protein